MKTEKSCGAVVFTGDSGAVQYVIIRSREGIYGFPKGHIEGTETEKETALREIQEETGLSVKLIEGFRREDAHFFTKDGETRRKHVVYFLAEFSHQIPVPQETELSSIHIMDYETALSVFQFPSSKQILTEAHRFLSRR